MTKRSWTAAYDMKHCPNCDRILMRLDFGPSTTTEDRKQPCCRECTKAIKLAKKSRQYRLTMEGRVTTIIGGLAYRTREAKRVMKVSREEIAKLLRKRRCAYCGIAMQRDSPSSRVTVDHIVPLARGGDTIPSNLVSVCWRCNHDKGARTLDEWSPRWYDKKGAR